MKETKSRKLMVFTVALGLVLLLMVTILGACGGSNPTTTQPTTPAGNQTTTAPTTAAPTTAKPTTAAPITLIFSSNETPDGFMAAGIWKPWMAKVEQASNGRIKFEAHWNSELYSIFDVYDAVAKGRVDLGEVITATAPNVFALEDLTTFSMYDKIVTQPSTVYMELYNKYQAIRDQYKSVHFVWAMATSTNWLASRTPIQSINDLKGKKIIAPGQWSAARDQALGMVPMTMAPPDCYPALQKGTLDCVAAPMSGLRDFKWVEVAPNITTMPVSAATFATLMSPQAWAKLPPDLQKIMTDVSADMPAIADKAQNESNAKEIAAFPAEFKANFYNLPAADLAQMNALDQKVKDDFAASLEAKGLPGKQIMQDYVELINKYSK